MQALNKLITFCHTDGFRQATNYLWQKITSNLGLRSLDTFYLLCMPDKSEKASFSAKNIIFTEVYTAEHLQELQYPRLSLLPYATWFRRGSRCFVGLDKKKVVSFCWIHSDYYPLRHSGNFSLSDHEKWIGPVFVDKAYRGLGINTLQISNVSSLLQQDGIEKIYTATSFANYGSMRSFIKCGYTVIGFSRIRVLFGICISKIVFNLNTQTNLKSIIE